MTKSKTKLRRVAPDNRKRSITQGDKRLTGNPRYVFMSVRVSPEERDKIKAVYGSLASLRDFALASTDNDNVDLSEYKVKDINKHISEDNISDNE